LREEGKYDEAAGHLQIVLAQYPRDRVAINELGRIQFLQKRYAEAEAELTRAIDLNPGSGAAHLYKARALIGLSRLDNAEQELQRAIAIGGEDVVLARRYLGGVYVEKKENAKAIRVLEEYLRLVPDSADTVQIRRLISQLRAPEKKG
jgi:tetratricopeptide (TPR) repeat protein